MGESNYCFVASLARRPYCSKTTNTPMRTNKPKRTNLWRIFSRRSTSAHDAWLILNMKQFNFEGSLSRVLARQQAQQFGR
jgi:hypothetical protein